jgi:serine/threonine-protein kinase HipA
VKIFPHQFITFTLPVREETYKSNRLFPFFEGLIPEGWLLNIASKNWKINPNDRMGLLLACCQNCIGAVSVQPIISEDEK